MGRKVSHGWLRHTATLPRRGRDRWQGGNRLHQRFDLPLRQPATALFGPCDALRGRASIHRLRCVIVGASGSGKTETELRHRPRTIITRLPTASASLSTTITTIIAAQTGRCTGLSRCQAWIDRRSEDGSLPVEYPLCVVGSACFPRAPPMSRTV